MPDFGPLGGLVGLVGSIVAAGAAIALTWRGRTKWEPSESDIANGAQKVGGLFTTVLIVILFAVTRGTDLGAGLVGIAILLMVIAVASLIAYGYVISTQTYDDLRNTRKIIGGFKLTNEARAAIRRRKVTIQEYLAGVGYDVDKVWPRPSRAIAKQLFVVLYLALIVSGSVALASTAIVLEKAVASPTPVPTILPTPTPVPTPTVGPTVAARTLQWVAEPDGTVLDGGIYEPGKEIWLQELFPAEPPTGFLVREFVSDSWPQDVRDAVAALAPPQFAPRVDGFRAWSNSAWLLPAPWSGGFPRTFTFADLNPDGTATLSGSITSGLAQLTVASDDVGCEPADGTGTHVIDAGTDGCIELGVTVSRDPTFDVSVLTPGGEGPNDILVGVRDWLDGLDDELARTAPDVKFSANRAFETFVQEHEAFLPAGLPNDWEVAPDRDVLRVAAGEEDRVQMTLRAQSGGSALFAIKLTDRSDGTTILSPFIPVTVKENTTPSVRITQPENDLVGEQQVSVTGEDANGWYADVDLVAVATDAEEGALTGSSIAWTTSRNGEGTVEAGTGDALRVRLYQTNCAGITSYIVTVTATDALGANDVTSVRIDVVFSPPCIT